MNRNNLQLINLTIILFIALVPLAHSYKILGLFFHAGKSHFDVFQPILQGLAEKGHNVTVLSFFPHKNPPKNYHDLPMTGIPEAANSVDLQMFANRKSFNHYLEFFFLRKWGYNTCDVALASPAVKKLLKTKEEYDVILVEMFNNDCALGLAHKFKAPFIGYSSCALMPWHYQRVGTAQIPSFIPSLFLGLSEKMSFMDRINNFFTFYGMQFLYRFFTDNDANILINKHLGPGIPDVGEIAKRTSLVMVNQHYSLSGSKPITPSVIEIGGIHIKEQKPLDKDLQKLLDSADNGVIYVSWGSMIRAETLPDDKREGILQALSMFPQQLIIWKYENETLPNQPTNVIIRKWLPQRDILCHPKVRLFISHGGLLGSTEAAYCGVPVVATPMYGDQFLNSAAMKDRGMGVVLDYEDITKETMYESMKTALQPEFAENARHVSYSFKNRLNKPLDTAIWWIEHTAATGGAKLTKTESTYLPFYIYHSMDVVFTILTVLLITIFSWIWMLKRIFGKRNSNDKRKTE